MIRRIIHQTHPECKIIFPCICHFQHASRVNTALDHTLSRGIRRCSAGILNDTRHRMLIAGCNTAGIHGPAGRKYLYRHHRRQEKYSRQHRRIKFSYFLHNRSFSVSYMAGQENRLRPPRPLLTACSYLNFRSPLLFNLYKIPASITTRLVPIGMNGIPFEDADAPSIEPAT